MCNLLFFSLHFFQGLLPVIHWKLKMVNLTTLSSLVAPYVVITMWWQNYQIDDLLFFVYQHQDHKFKIWRFPFQWLGSLTNITVNTLQVGFFPETYNISVFFYNVLALRWHRYFKSFVMEAKDLLILHGQHNGSWWWRYARSHSIGPVSKIRKYNNRSDVHVTFELYHNFRCLQVFY